MLYSAHATCFVLDHGIHMNPDNPHPPANLRRDVHQALRAWHAHDNGQSPLQYLRVVQQHYGADKSWRQATNQALLLALEELESAQNPDVASLLRARFLDDKPIKDVARNQNQAESTVHRRQTAAITYLAEVLWAQELRALATQQDSLAERLPEPGYSRLFGVEGYLARLQPHLVNPEPPWLIALHGIGGIGKTTLADALLRQVIQQGKPIQVGWVTAKDQIFNLGGSLQPLDLPILTAEGLIDALVAQLLPTQHGDQPLSSVAGRNALHHLLKQQPHLIVIDNLETVTDVASLLPTLQGLANPTRFLLTTRESRFDEPGIAHHAVPELTYADALRLMRFEAQMRNLVEVVTTPDEVLAPIYETVGGNPLALRLVIGQLHSHSLTTVLEDLRNAHNETSTNLYTFIYEHAWSSLDEAARNVLLAMVLVPPEGAELSLIAAASQVAPVDLHRAIQTLTQHNLVDARGTIQQRMYTIHGLTRTFLQQQVAQWPTP